MKNGHSKKRSLTRRFICCSCRNAKPSEKRSRVAGELEFSLALQAPTKIVSYGVASFYIFGVFVSSKDFFRELRPGPWTEIL